MRTILAACLLSFCAAAPAETWITASIASYHFDRKEVEEDDLCEVNPGIGAQHGTRRARLEFGTFQNSRCRPSMYFGGSLRGKCWLLSRLQCGAALVAFTGYDEEKKSQDGTRRRENKALIAPLGLVAWEGRRYGLELVLMPPERLGRLIGRKTDEDEFKGAVGLRWTLLFQ
jgi:hypothetical protein